MKAFLFSSALFLPLVSNLRAEDIASGPDKGKKVPALKVFDATGAHKDKNVDYSAERKDKPTIYYFIQADKWDRPMARFLRSMDEEVRKADDGTYLVAVWLTEKPDDTKDYLPKAQMSLKFEITALTCFTGEKAGPKDWNINSMAHITVVIANKGQVASTAGYASINDTEVKNVLEALKKAKEKK